MVMVYTTHKSGDFGGWFLIVLPKIKMVKCHAVVMFPLDCAGVILRVSVVPAVPSFQTHL